MFCPECKAEYVEGITECADCHVPLVWALPQEEEKDFQNEPIEWTPLLTSTYEADIAFVRSVLEGEEIAHWIDGENRGIIRRGNMGSVIYVDSARLQDAQTLIRDLDLNAFSWSARSNKDLDG